MKVLDENLPQALARSLNALFAGEHEIVHLRERFGPAVSDVEWSSGRPIVQKYRPAFIDARCYLNLYCPVGWRHASMPIASAGEEAD